MSFGFFGGTAANGVALGASGVFYDRKYDDGGNEPRQRSVGTSSLLWRVAEDSGWRARAWSLKGHTVGMFFFEWMRFFADCWRGPFEVSVLSNRRRRMMTRIITTGALQCFYLSIRCTGHITRRDQIYLLLLRRDRVQVVRHLYGALVA